MSPSFVQPPVQPPDYPGEQYQPPQPNFQPKKILSTPVRIILAIAGAVAVLLVIGLVAASASHSSPYAQGVAFDSGDTAAAIGQQVLVGWLTANDPYDMSTQAGTQWALGAEVGYEQRVLIGDPANDGTTITSVVVDPATVTLSSDGLSFQAVLTFSDGTSQTSAVTDPLTGWNQGVYGASWSSAPAPADTQAPVTQAPADTSAPSDTSGTGDTPAPAPASSSQSIAAIRQQAQSDLYTVQGISFSADTARLDKDVQVAGNDESAYASAAYMPNDITAPCPNLAAVHALAAKINNDANAVPADAAATEHDIQAARGHVSSLQDDIATLQGLGQPAPPGAQAAITSAQDAISQAVSQANGDIDQDNNIMSNAVQATDTADGFGCGSPSSLQSALTSNINIEQSVPHIG